MKPLLLLVPLFGGCSLLFDGKDLSGRGDLGATAGDDLAGAGGAVDLAGGSADLAGSSGDLGPRLATLSFSAGTAVVVGGSPWALGVGDFDGDGHIDVATANNGTKDVTLLFGDGHGALGDAHLLTMPQPAGASTCTPYALTVANLDGKGPVDLAVTCSDLGSVNGGAVYLGAASRVFAIQTLSALQTTTAIHPESIAAGDFNHDGKLDLAVGAYTQPGQVLLYYGAGDGTFAAASTLVAGPTVTTVAVGDLNGDGRDNLVAANGAAGTVGVYLQEPATNSLSSAVDYNAVSNPDGVRLFDLNHDGHLDIVTCDPANFGVVVLLNAASGNGTFPAGAGGAEPPEYAVHAAPTRPAFADFDLDGNLDIVTANPNGSVDVLRGLGDGTFKPALTLSGAAPSDVQVADFDQDGLVDFVVSNNRNPGSVTIYRNTSH